MTAVLLLSSCGGAGGAAGSQPDSRPAVAKGIRLPHAKGTDAVMLYNRFSQRFAAYDVPTKSIQEQSDENNYFQYEFRTQSDYYTAGSSLKNGFEILRVNGDKLVHVLKLPADQGAFPLATDGTQRLFTVSTYKAGDEVDRKLASLSRDNRLEPYSKVGGLIDSGVIIGNTLYFSVFHADTKTYSILTIDPSDHEAVPKLHAEGLTSGHLFNHDGRLYTADRKSIFNKDDKFTCSDLCYFFDDYDILARIHVDGQHLSLDIVDTKSKKVVKTFTGIVDFRVSNGKVVVYQEGRIDRFALKR